MRLVKKVLWLYGWWFGQFFFLLLKLLVTGKNDTDGAAGLYLIAGSFYFTRYLVHLEGNNVIPILVCGVEQLTPGIKSEKAGPTLARKLAWLLLETLFTDPTVATIVL